MINTPLVIRVTEGVAGALRTTEPGESETTDKGSDRVTLSSA
jgi:hypothetical protein